MNKSYLIRKVHERMKKKVSLKVIDQLVDVIMEVIFDKLKTGEEVQIHDFGAFRLSDSALQFAVKINDHIYSASG